MGRRPTPPTASVTASSNSATAKVLEKLLDRRAQTEQVSEGADSTSSHRPRASKPSSILKDILSSTPPPFPEPSSRTSYEGTPPLASPSVHEQDAPVSNNSSSKPLQPGQRVSF